MLAMSGLHYFPIIVCKWCSLLTEFKIVIAHLLFVCKNGPTVNSEIRNMYREGFEHNLDTLLIINLHGNVNVFKQNPWNCKTLTFSLHKTTVLVIGIIVRLVHCLQNWRASNLKDSWISYSQSCYISEENEWPLEYSWNEFLLFCCHHHNDWSLIPPFQFADIGLIFTNCRYGCTCFPRLLHFAV